MGHWATIGTCSIAATSWLALIARAAVSTWNGGAGNWSDANWTGGVPNSQTTDAVIDSNPAVNSVVTITPGISINNLTVDFGDALVLNPTNPASISTFGNWTINGTVGSATSRYGGPFLAAAPLISGSGTLFTGGLGGPAPLTFGPNLTVRASGGNFGGAYVFQGSFILDDGGTQNGLFLGQSILASTNAGHIQMNAGAFFDATNFNNTATGVLDLNNDHAFLRVSLTNAGAINMNNTLLELRASATASGLDNIHLLGGTNELDIAGTVDNTNHVFAVNSGTVVISSSGGVGRLIGGTVNASAGGSFQLGGGTLRDVTLAGNIVFKSSLPTVTIEGNLTLDNVNLPVPVNQPLGGGVMQFSGTSAGQIQHIAGNGSITFDAGNSGTAGILASGGSTIVIDAGITISGSGYLLGPVINYGTLIGGTSHTSGQGFIVSNFTNNGSLIIPPSALFASQSAISQSPSAVTQVNGTLLPTNQANLQIVGGTVSGTGLVDASTGSLMLGTIVSPGAGGTTAAAAASLALSLTHGPHAASPANTGGGLAGLGAIGTLTANAQTVVFQSGSHLQVELSGSNSADLLAVTGNLDLSGLNDSLDISPLGPLTGSSYLVATYTGSLSGIFDNVTPGYEVSYATPGEILVAPIPEPAAAMLATIGAARLSMCRRRRSRKRALKSINR
jgi:hypothetical protein